MDNLDSMISRDRRCQEFDSFSSPPSEYGIVPFYWWQGDPLTKERLQYQLDLLADHHICGLQVNYAHSDVGGRAWGLTYEGKPPIFSEEWWELFGWFLDEAKKRGMSVSLSDYTLFAPGQGYFTDKVLARRPEMTGQRLNVNKTPVSADEAVSISMPSAPLCVAVLSDDGDTEHIDYSFSNGVLSATPNRSGELFAVYAETVPYTYDPMHPSAGDEIIDVFFGEFERRFPNECGRGLNFFFSDELEFGISGNLWNDFFAEEFIARKGYDIRPHLYNIFREGADTVKTRLDYYDVIVALEEENYFKKVYNWHEERNMTYGCDHGGRGHNVTEFGDYMRTQKYNQGPGCDQPNLSSDIIKNKVASSISHLYKRPRVWLEGFYGSGWGTSTEQLTDAVARNFVMGQNLLSLHGLYYSTHGGFWEWAPPCNCFRMPYWKHMETFLGAVKRLSYALARGVHCCDIGLVYPVDAVDGGIDSELAVSTAFNLGETLYSHGIDFDFLDRESIVNAELGDGALKISDEVYRFVVIPEMRSLRSDAYRKLLEAAEAGVQIISIGALPKYSDRDVSDICLRLADMCRFFINIGDVEAFLAENSRRDVLPETTEKFYIHHRKVGELDLYMTYGIPRGEHCFFRGQGSVVWLNARDGKKYLIEDVESAKDGVTVEMPVESSEFQVLVIGDIEHNDALHRIYENTSDTLALNDVWNFELLPTMDNSWGDFELPATDGLLPCQIKEVVCDGHRVKVGYGAYFLAKEAFANDEEYRAALEAANRSDIKGFDPYEFSMRYGVDGAPGHQGYHGLKGNITDDFLTVGKKVAIATSEEFVPYDSGFGKVFYTNIFCDEAMSATILTGGLKPDDLYVNGKRVDEHTVKLNHGLNRIVAGYRNCGRTHLVFAVGGIDDATIPLSMRWFKNSDILPFDCYVDNKPQIFKFMSPPALCSLEIPCEGEVAEVWFGNKKAAVSKNSGIYTASVETPSALPCEVKLTVENTRGQYGGAVFYEPIREFCGKGQIPIGDWSLIDGLKFYSGGAAYSQTVHIDDEKSRKNAVLSADRIVSTAEAFVNGQSVGVRFAPPWKWDISDALREGDNEIRLEVFNTIGNHYEYLPTRYKSGTESGLIGKVHLEFCAYQD